MRTNEIYYSFSVKDAVYRAAPDSILSRKSVQMMNSIENTFIFCKSKCKKIRIRSVIGVWSIEQRLYISLSMTRMVTRVHDSGVG